MGYQQGASNVWFNLPGIQAAYQPIAAPNYKLSLQNVGKGRAGSYTATPGTAPTWTPALGWTFNGSSQYLSSGVNSSPTTTAIVQFSGASESNSAILGEYVDGNHSFMIIPYRSNTVWYYTGSQVGNQYVQIAPGLAAGNLSFSAATLVGYRNGLYDGVIYFSPATGLMPIWIGSRYYSGGADYWAGNIQALAIYSRGLTAIEARQAAIQMKYCHQNPDWNAWAPRRRYYPILPSTSGRIYGPPAQVM